MWVVVEMVICWPLEAGDVIFFEFPLSLVWATAKSVATSYILYFGN